MDESNLTNMSIRPAKKLLTLLTHEVVLLLFFGIVAGLILANDYGLSWDEYYNETYARHTIEMYLGDRVPGDTIIDKRFYGPSFFVPWLLARDLLVKILPSLSPADAGHAIYWLAFLPAPLFVYGLSRRYAGRIASLAAALLFASQPVIFGHAFVNSTDPPFMTTFLAALWVGLLAVDLSKQSDKWLPLYRIPSEATRLYRRLVASWRTSATWRKATVCILCGAFILTSVELLVTHRPLQWLYLLVQRAYAGQAFGPVQALFNTVAQDAYKTPLSAYLDKARIFYLWVRFPILIVGSGLLIYISSRILGTCISWRWFSRTRTWWAWLIAAIALGLCSAIRVFGPFAGALVVLYALVRLNKRAWLPIVVYGSISLLVLYAAWPSLWVSPLQSLAESIFRMGRFPWEGRVLYDGHVYSVVELPWHYVPRSIVLQLSLPAVALSGLGLLVVLIAVAKKTRMAGGVFLLLIWSGLPLATVALFRVHIYSAFRQLMFVLPAIFILGSIGFEKILGLARGAAWTPLVIGVALAPGLIGIIRLHPYEMIYYNELVGGVSGASGRYGLDTWGTTYREVVEYLNKVAPQGASVLVNTRELHTMTPFARADLHLSPLTPTAIQSSSSGTYIVNGGHLSESFQAMTIYVVEREGILLATVQSVP